MSKIVNAEAFSKGLLGFTNLEQINARLQAKGIPHMDDHAAATLALVRAEGIRDQGSATVLAVNLANAKITGEDVTALLVAGFPAAKIGKRHGPHYLSLARTGKLEGVENRAIAHKARTASTTAGTPAVVVPAVKAVVPDLPEPSEAELDRVAAQDAAELAAMEHLETAIVDAVVAEVILDPRQELSALDRASLVVKAKSLGVKASGKDQEIIERILSAGV